MPIHRRVSFVIDVPLQFMKPNHSLAMFYLPALGLTMLLFVAIGGTEHSQPVSQVTSNRQWVSPLPTQSLFPSRGYFADPHLWHSSMEGDQQPQRWLQQQLPHGIGISRYGPGLGRWILFT